MKFKTVGPDRISPALFFVAALLPGAVSSATAQPSTLKPETLYSFACCGAPYGSAISGGKGLVYGTSYLGGSGKGTAFALLSGPHGWTEEVLVDFDSDWNPSGLISVGDVLYGTADQGDPTGPSRYGAVFELTRSGSTWTQTILYNFTGGYDGANPEGNLVMGSNGALYGSTKSGGIKNQGTIFELAPPAQPGGAWTETVLHPFTGAGDGQYPLGALVIGANGDLYGTTAGGGETVCANGGCGTVFQLSPQTGNPRWKIAILYVFVGGASDGNYPSAGLAIHGSGNLYGMTKYGGSGVCPDDPVAISGCGVAFELSPPATEGGAWTEKILHTFAGGKDGANPVSALVLGSNGALFGTTPLGGSTGLGTLFELEPRINGVWTESRYTFTGQNGDGASPTAGLTLGGGGILYGTTDSGGTSNAGTVFDVIF